MVEYQIRSQIVTIQIPVRRKRMNDLKHCSMCRLLLNCLLSYFISLFYFTVQMNFQLIYQNKTNNRDEVARKTWATLSVGVFTS